MSQAGPKQGLLLPDTTPRAQVLAPFPVAKAYDYRIPSSLTLTPGDYVRVPLGKKETVGVVWDLAKDTAVDPAKIKYILQKYPFQPMPLVHREFIEWVSRYTMADLGTVLKMSLSVPEALLPSKTVPAYVLPSPRRRGSRAMRPWIPVFAGMMLRAGGVGSQLTVRKLSSFSLMVYHARPLTLPKLWVAVAPSSAPWPMPGSCKPRRYPRLHRAR